MAAQGHPDGLDVGQAKGGGHFRVLRKQQFTGRDFLGPLPQFLLLFDVQPRPVAGGYVHPREAPPVRFRVPEQRAKIGVALGLKADVVNGCAGSVDPGHGAVHQPLGGAGVLHLIAEGDFIAFVQKLADVPFRGVPRDPAHGDGRFRVGVARRERDLQLTGRNFGILKKKFIKIAHAVKEQGIRIALLDAEVLFKHGSEAGR